MPHRHTHPFNRAARPPKSATRFGLSLLVIVFATTGSFTARCSAQNPTSSRDYPAAYSYSQASFPAQARVATSAPVVVGDRLIGNDDPTYLRSTYREPLGTSPVDPLSRYNLTAIESARQSAEQFRAMAQSTSSVVTKVASDNANFADQWASLAESYQSLSTRYHDAVILLRSTTHDYEDVRSKLTNFGLTPTVGLLLRHKKDQLDAWHSSDSLALFATEELARSRRRQLDLEMLRFNGSDSLRQATELLAEAGVVSNSFQYASVSAQVQNLLNQRYQWIEVLKQGYVDYQQKLSELDSTHTAYAKLNQEYRALISRYIIWIPSDDTLGLTDLRNLKTGLGSLFDSRRSAEFGYSLRRKWDANPVGGVGMLSLVALILLLRWRAKTWLVDIGGRKRMRDATPNSRKVAAGVLTTLVAFGFPGVLYVLARWLGTEVVFESTLHVSSGLYAASLIALMVEMPRQLLCNYGYLDKHLGIELPRRQRANAYLTLIGIGLVIAAYLVTVASLIDHGMWRDSTSRIGLILSLMLVAWTAHLALRPHGGFLEPLIEKFGGSVVHRLRFVIYLAGVGFPLLLIALSALGYGFTVQELIYRAVITWVVCLIAATLWSSVKILSSRAWQMLTGTTPPRRFDQYGEIKSDSTTSVLAEHYLELKHHLAFLCQCALVLGAVVCLGWLWIDVFPEVRMGNPVLWTIEETIARTPDGQTLGTFNRQADSATITQATPVTVLHVALAAATLFVAFQLAKLLPALFDAVVLQRVSFDEGMEHFSLVLGRCFLFGTGCYVACSLLGVRWQSIQWLAVGLTIGLGFGLQDMVRNLFGGFVVLFEKPARLGDLITVGRVTGRVAAQKFRTTVLSDDEGRELIIPNKNFVSEEVVNWMGAGRLHAVPLEVAVKRDVRAADICRSLQELVIEQPEVLLTPAPHATLVCISKSSQRIEVRAWVEDNHDPVRYRETLLKIVLKFLREKDLLVSVQPDQPPMRRGRDGDEAEPYGAIQDRKRKRSA